MLAGGGSNIVPLPPRCCRENNVFPVQRQYFICTRQPRQMAMSEPLRVGRIAVETRLAPASSCRRARPESVSPTRRSEDSAARCTTRVMGHLPHANPSALSSRVTRPSVGRAICVRDRLRPAPCGQGSPCRPQPSGERHGEVAVGGARLSDRLAREVGNSHAEILGPTLRVDAVLGRPGLQCLRRELPLHRRLPSRASR